ncbi:MAG TPA: YggT family protein, partial [Gammaproteobacteria bacterium]|nr:YggT family protein [Gammaproteobacteria bacterium]
LLVIVLIGYSAGFLGLLVTAFAELIGKALKLFTLAVFIQIVLSWVAPGTYNPVVGIIDSITSPLLRPARRLLPPFGGIDFSPMLVIIALTLGLMLVVAPLRDFGRALM